MKQILVATTLMGLLSACSEGVAGRGSVAEDQLFAPGVARGADLVDPLIVGDRLLEAGEADLALSSYVRAASKLGMTTEVRIAMSQANLALGRLGQAERLLRDVIEEEPRNAPALNNLGVVLLEQGEIGEAHIFFKTAFALQPTPEIRENLRLSTAKLENAAYSAEQDNAFTLSRRANGAYNLEAPEQYP
ncbi:tetratricopeptide repeat protein [Jannaschia pohangensis]|uniref:Tetratricopeptide repeat-containing protein n=1 Tax=Jannaschia pohangensis TaxID=390807 RepID=A0A1I3LUL1_9RHOB|nr:tetratricopeptide repeat protein [Jannaschia pohangensis]SFI88363.1 Tetratricopeptide repeat-containing protein [Jannaschia pohangensis]